MIFIKQEKEVNHCRVFVIKFYYHRLKEKETIQNSIMVKIHISYDSVNYPFIVRMLYLNEVKKLYRLNPEKYPLRYIIQ